MKKLVSILAIAITCCASLSAQTTDSVQQTQSKFKVRPIGRILMDGAAFITSDKEAFHDGVGIPQIQLGAVMSYGKWDARVELGLRHYKLSLCDLYIQYNFDKNFFLRAGSFIHPFGLESQRSSSMKTTYENPLPEAVFNPGRNLGVMAQYDTPAYWGGLSVHAGVEAMRESSNESEGQGFGVSTRQVFRYNPASDKFVQLGISGGFNLPSGNKAGANFKLKGNYPTSINQVPVVCDTITNALNQFRFSPEIFLGYGRVALKGQYYYSRINMRDNMSRFVGQGAYITLRGLILGKSYSYLSKYATVDNPSPKSLELALGYAYTTLSDKKAQYINEEGTICQGIYGGRANQLSATMTYYINKYMCARLNYTFTHSWDSSRLPSMDLGVIQARFQVIF